MNKTLFALTSTTVALFAFGCQPKTKTKTVTVEVPKKEKVYNFKKQSAGAPIDVPVFDKSCTTQRGLGLSNNIIEAAYTDVEFVRTSTSIEEDVWEQAKQKEILRETTEVEVINSGRVISLCRDASSIPANTREGAAIGMKAAADAAFGLYQNVKAKGQIVLPELGRIHLNAVVKVKLIDRTVSKSDEAHEETNYLTDNAVFNGGEEPTLTSYPQSETSQKFKLLGGVPLWTVDGVFQHEFGHYVFGSIMNEGGSPFSSYEQYAAENPDLHLFYSAPESFARIAGNAARAAKFADFVATQDFFIGSLNEGFADMWSYYTLKQPATMFEISCFAKNRNIASDTFFNGMAKSWDENLWKNTFQPVSEEELFKNVKTPLDACSLPVFSDIHIVGAAIAHTADAIFTEAAKAQTESSRDPSELKAEMALNWLKSIKDSDEFQDLGGKASLSRILNTAIGTGIRYLGSAEKTSFCAVVSNKFPVLVKRWKDAKTDNEDVSGVVSFCSL